MNYIQLVQDLHAESMVSSPAPSSVTNQIGQLADLVRWIKDAWNEIAGIRDEWLFKLTDVSFNTTIGVGDYDPALPPFALPNFSDWVPNSFRYFTLPAGVTSEQFVGWMQYPEFRDYYLFGSWRTTKGPPIAMCSAPNKHLLIGPLPDKVYTIIGQYQSYAPELVLDTDVPGIPARFHKLIVYRALQAYALTLAAPEALAKAERGEARLMPQLMRHQLPVPQWPQPMA